MGGKQALYLLGQALLRPGRRGDRARRPTGRRSRETVRLAGATPVLVRHAGEGRLQVTARMIAQGHHPATKAVLLNSPVESHRRGDRARGPAGDRRPGPPPQVHGPLRRHLRATLSFRRGRAACSQALRDSVGDRLVVLGTASKTYCMTGWRIGWVLGPRALIDACAALFSHSTQCPATFAQVGAVEALTGPQELVRRAARASTAAARFRPLRPSRRSRTSPAVEPAGGFYVFPNVARYLTRAVPTTLALGLRLLEEKGVAVVPGEGFGAPGYLRLSFARSMDELARASRAWRSSSCPCGRARRRARHEPARPSPRERR